MADDSPLVPADTHPEPAAGNEAPAGGDSLRERLERARQQKRQLSEAGKAAVSANLIKGRERQAQIRRENDGIRDMERQIKERERQLKRKELEAREAELNRREQELDEIIGRALRREVRVSETPKYQEAAPEEKPVVARMFNEAVDRRQPRKLVDFF